MFLLENKQLIDEFCKYFKKELVCDKTNTISIQAQKFFNEINASDVNEANKKFKTILKGRMIVKQLSDNDFVYINF